MIVFAANAISGNSDWRAAWRQFSCRYRVSTTSSNFDNADWSSLDALLQIGDVKFYINRGQGSASSGSTYPRSDALISGVGESVNVAMQNNIQNSRPISGINVNVEPGGPTAFLQRVGANDNTEMPTNGLTWTSSDPLERRSIREEILKSFPGVFTYSRETIDEGEFIGTQPTWSQTHQALINWYTAAEETVRTHNGSQTGLLVSQWWKTPSVMPFFGAGWWGSGAYPTSSCSTTQEWNLPCRAASQRHDWLGRRTFDYDPNTNQFIQNTNAPNNTQWVNNGWANAVENYAAQYYENSVGILGTADIMPLQWYSMPYTEQATAAWLDVQSTNGFARASFNNQYESFSDAVESRKANLRAVWRAASERYGNKVAIGSRWMVDSNSSGWLGAWAPTDLWREIMDHAFEPYPGSIAPKHIALWGAAGFLDELFQSGTGTPSDNVEKSRRITAQRFAGRSSVEVNWNTNTEAGTQWRLALAAMFDEDTYERVLIAKSCIKRARTKHSARGSTLGRLTESIQRLISG
jgi:hypothetical protein